MQPEGNAGGGLLLVHAHPDDEAVSTAGVIARALAEGRRVDLVICTGGEEGEIHDPDLDAAEAQPRLAQIRRAELGCSVAALEEAATGGARLHLHMLGYRDSGMMGTQANERADSFWRADIGDAVRRLVQIVRGARPAAIATYDENGNYGHPDHINAARIAREAFDVAADGSRHPEAGAPQAVERFYEIAFNREAWFALSTEMRERGISIPWESAAAAAEAGSGEERNPTDVETVREVSEEAAEGEAPGDFGTPEELITTRVDVAAYAERKRASMRCHRTQQQDMGWLLDLPDDLGARALSTEYFVLRRRRSEPIPEGYREDWLF